MLKISEKSNFGKTCDGNTKGVCALIRGMKAKEVIARLKGLSKLEELPNYLSLDG